MASLINRVIMGIRKFIYLQTQESIVKRIDAETIREEKRATELQKILDAKQKLVNARAKSQQIMKKIDEVANGKRKEHKD